MGKKEKCQEQILRNPALVAGEHALGSYCFSCSVTPVCLRNTKLDTTGHHLPSPERSYKCTKEGYLHRLLPAVLNLQS